MSSEFTAELIASFGQAILRPVLTRADLFGKMCSKYLKTWGRRRGLVRCGKRGGGGGAFKDS